MDLNHLHFHVKDLDETAAFYGKYFQFEKHAQYGELVFLRNPEGFDLALEPGALDPMPKWFHFGFRLSSAQQAKDLHERMTSDGLAGLEDFSEFPTHVSFVCLDPNGYAIEIYADTP